MDLAELQKALDVHARRAMMVHGPTCDIEQDGNELVLYCDKPALLHIANRILKLALTDVSGSHFTIDKADIAPDAEASITIARRE